MVPIAFILLVSTSRSRSGRGPLRSQDLKLLVAAGVIAVGVLAIWWAGAIRRGRWRTAHGRRGSDCWKRNRFDGSYRALTRTRRS